MCGRYTLTETDHIKARFQLSAIPKDLHQNFNVAPTQQMPVILSSGGDTVCELMRWGIPRFIGPGKTRDVFNTRADKAFHSWKTLTLTRRALVPATGFYEWKMQAGGKQPYFIHPKDEGLFAFAGIWNSWRESDGSEMNCFSIITCEPNKEMSAIHNRMPVILHKSDEAQWLSPDNDNNQDVIEALLMPYEDDGLTMYQVSTDVNMTKNNNQQLVYPLNSQ